MALVLIVEDSDSAAPLEMALSTLNGLEIVVVANGRDALAFLHSTSGEIVAIITDLHLPLVDGFELVAAVRSDSRYSRLPILVVSGDNHPRSFSRVRELGANACFTKPYSPAEICRTLKDLLHAS